MDREMNSDLDRALKDEYNFDAGAQGMKGENSISKRGEQVRVQGAFTDKQAKRRNMAAYQPSLEIFSNHPNNQRITY